jgi:5'-methylthioadenosine phosphorylase
VKLKNLKKADMGIIGGTGLEALLRDAEQIRVGTPYGLPPAISIGEINGKPVAFLPRHGVHHSIPPHMVNYRANIYALHKIGVEQIAATNAVGAINPDFKHGDLVVPHDFVDFTRVRSNTFYDSSPVTHVDLSQPYCPVLRLTLVNSAKKYSKLWEKAVLVCTEGPRYETSAEIKMFKQLGCDIVGMTGTPEAVLARELEMCYATICFVTNMAAGMQQRLTADEVAEVAKKVVPVLEQILRETIKNLPRERHCPCVHALREARLRG